MNSVKTLPFNMDDDSINKWLKHYQPQQNPIGIDQIYNILRYINLKNVTLKSYFLIVDKITAQILKYADQSNLALLSKNQEFKAKQKPVKLAISLIKALTLAYSNISDHQGFSTCFNEKQQALIINRGIACIGLIIKQEALIQEPAPSSFYSKMGDLYRAGINFRLLDQPTNDTISQFLNHPTITASIKINLLFSIINTFALTAKQIISVHGLIIKAGDLLETKSDNKSGDVDLYWDYQSP